MKRRTVSAFLVVFMFLITILSNVMIVNAEESERLLKLGLGGAIENANPFRGIMEEEHFFYCLIYDYLIIIDEDFNPQPNIAESWWYMDGVYAASTGSTFADSNPADWPTGSIWEYNITDGVLWNDGMPLTADDIVWTFNIQIGPNFNSYWAYHPVIRWIDHAEKVGDEKVRIFFKHFATNEPMPVAWGYSLSVPIMPKHKFEDKPGPWMAQTWNGAPGVGTGPFIATDNLIEDLLCGESITLLKNPWYNYTENGVQNGIGAYYHRDVQIDKLLLKFFSEEASLAINVKTGDIDAAEIAPDTYIKWKNESEQGKLPERLNILSMLSGAGYSKEIVIDAYTNKTGDLNPLRLDPAVMRAAAIAINKTALIDIAYNGLAVEGIGLISPVWPEWWWEPGDEMSTFNVTGPNGEILFTYSKPMKEVMEYDPDLANQILDAAGYNWSGEVGNSVRAATQVAGDRLQTILGIPSAEALNFDLTFENLIYAEVFEDREIANYQVSAWAEVGITSNNLLLNMAERNIRCHSYSFETMISHWSADVDPNYILYIPTSHALWGWNEFGTENDTYDYYFEKQATTLDYDERKKWVDECLKWQYLSGSINTVAYPNACLAFNDIRWTNWGNWSEHPRIAIDTHSGANPLWFNLQYVTDESAWIEQLMPYGIIMIGLAVAIAALYYFFGPRKGSPEISSILPEDSA